VVAVALEKKGQPIFGEDTWLRLSLGEAYASAGPWLPADPLLFAASGPPAPAAWLSDLALRGVERGAGFTGLRLAHVLLVAAILALAWQLLRAASGSALFASLGTALFASASAYRLFQLRPHLASVLFALLVVRLLVVEGRPPARARIAATTFVFALWANAHGAFVVGLALLAAAAAGAWLACLARAAAAPERTRALRLSATLLCGGLATLANPEAAAPHLLYFSAGVDTPELAVVADEWAALDLLAWPPANLPPSLLSWGLAWGCLLGLAAALGSQRRAWRAGGGLDPVLAAVALVSLAGLLSAVRLLWLAVFPLALIGQWGRLGGAFAPLARRTPAVTGAFALLALLLAPAFYYYGDWPMISRALVWERYSSPYPAVKYSAHGVWFLKDAGLEGRLYNDYASGNFLGYWLAPRMQVLVNGSLNVPKDVMLAQQALERREGAREGESFTDTLDRLGIDVFFGSELPLVSRANRVVLPTTTHLERTPGWIPVFRSLRSAVYLRVDERNAANLERVAAYHAERGVPFDREHGLSLERVIREAPDWAVRNGILPTHHARLEAAVRALQPASRRAAREHLASLYATLGLYDRALALDRSQLAAEPGSRTAARRSVWCLLHERRFADARRAAERLEAFAADTGDPLSRALLETAVAATSSSEPAAVARVATLPFLTPFQAQQVLTGILEPEARLPER